MSPDLSFSVVESKYDPKLTIAFPYDESLVDDFQTLRKECWEETHTTFHKPDSDYDSVIDVDYKCWHVDHTENALEEVEAVTDISIPDAYWPSSLDESLSTSSESSLEPGTSFSLTPTEDGTTLEIEPQPDNLSLTLSSDSMAQPDGGTETALPLVLSEPPFPAGLTTRVGATLKQVQESPTIIKGESDLTPETELEITWRGPASPDSDLQRLFDRLFETQRGSLVIPDRDPATAVARLLYTINRNALILTPTLETSEDVATSLNNYLSVNVAAVSGDSNTDPAPVTVTPVETAATHGFLNQNSIDYDLGAVVIPSTDVPAKNSLAADLGRLASNLPVTYRVAALSSLADLSPCERVGLEAFTGPHVFTPT